MAKDKQKIAPPVKALKGQEVQYRKQMNKLGKALIKAVHLEVLPFLKSEQSAYVIDGIGSQLGVIFRRLNLQFNGTITAGFAEVTATQMVERLNVSNKNRFDKSIEKVTGVDLGNIITTEGLSDFMETSILRNTSLIKTLPQQYLSQVETIVTNGVASGARYSTIAKQITASVGSANSKLAGRIKTIATDQIQTINAQMTLRRSENLGITKGIYRTSEDEKVRACHAELNGVEYDLKVGAWSKTCKKYIQPGITDINCRCSYSPVINLEEL